MARNKEMADAAYEYYKELKQEISKIEKRKREALSRRWETFEDVKRYKEICDELEEKRKEIGTLARLIVKYVYGPEEADETI